MKALSLIGILVALSTASHQRSVDKSLSYIGAVVEYSSAIVCNGVESVLDCKLQNHMKLIEKAFNYNVDILVFSESSLSLDSSSSNGTIARSEGASYIPAPQDEVVPCNDTSGNYTDTLKTLSCAAQKYDMYIVINHHEKVDCKVSSIDCPDDGLLIYNTNVVLDRNGQVIARYRKYNLFGEKDINREPVAIPSVFKTDFGVTFGQFICFDILYEEPALNLTRNLGVTDIIFSTHWYSELPLAYSVEVQAAWAYANDVNFLASGYNDPKTATGGSGIYIGQQGYVHVVSERKASNILVVAEIPKVINGKRAININKEKLHVITFNNTEISSSEVNGTVKYPYKLNHLSAFTSELIDVKLSSYNKTICDRDLCCDFKLQLDYNDDVVGKDSKYYRYRLAVFNGIISYGGVTTGGTTICGIVACTGDSLHTCGKLFEPDKNFVKPLTFRSIDVRVPKIKKIFFMPITLTENMHPLNASAFSMKTVVQKGSEVYEMTLTEPRSDLLDFACVGRNFTLDGGPITRGLSPAMSSSPVVLWTVVLVCLMEYLQYF